jgi:hypothetical protein
MVAIKTSGEGRHRAAAENPPTIAKRQDQEELFLEASEAQANRRTEGRRTTSIKMS